MKNRLSSRLRLTLSGVTLLTLLLMCALVFAGMYFQTTADNREQLRQQAVQLSSYLDASDDPVSLLHGSVFTQRVTYLDTDGTVLYDSEVDASRLESHAGREEFQQARENGEAFTAIDTALLIQAAMLIAGIGTLIQLYPVWRIGSRLPVVMVLSFTFLSAMMTLAPVCRRS